MKKKAAPASVPTPGSVGLLPPDDFHPLLECRHADPHRILGIRKDARGGSVARVFHPGASTVWLDFTEGATLPLTL
jgi:hypothetical protein